MKNHSIYHFDWFWLVIVNNRKELSIPIRTVLALSLQSLLECSVSIVIVLSIVEYSKTIIVETNFKQTIII